jgi:hypothetical protein
MLCLVLGDYFVQFLGFGLLRRSKFYNGIELGYWDLVMWLSCVGCAGCCTLIFPSFLLISNRHGISGTWFR